MSAQRDHFQEAVGPVVRAMRENLAAGLTLADMADIACLSPFHFHRVFHQAAGIPPGQFLTALRMDAAKRLLLTTTESVVDVCFAVGYSSPGTFTTGFTRLVGETPERVSRAAPRFRGDGNVGSRLWRHLPAPHRPPSRRQAGSSGRRTSGASSSSARSPSAFPRPCRWRASCWNSRGRIACAPSPTAPTTSWSRRSRRTNRSPSFFPATACCVGIGERPLAIAHGVARTPWMSFCAARATPTLPSWSRCRPCSAASRLPPRPKNSNPEEASSARLGA